MPLPRLQLFEFNETPRAPAAIRDTLVEALSLMLARGRMLEGLVPVFADFLQRTGATEVLDLCAGAGGPAAALAAALRRAGRRPPRFLETDLLPHPDAWEALRRADPEAIDYVPEPVDATAVPRELAAGRVQVLVNGFHHLRPPLAAAVLRSACAHAPGVFVAEGFERNPLRFLPMAPAGVRALPEAMRRAGVRPWVRPLLLPVMLGVAAWDGFVSTMRVYTEAELRAMVAPLGDAFEWRYGTWDFGLGGRSYWFSGLRRGRGT